MAVGWIVFALATLGCLVTVLRQWIFEWSRRRTAASRYAAWMRIAAGLPLGSWLTGTEPGCRTVVRIGPAIQRKAAEKPWESRGER